MVIVGVFVSGKVLKLIDLDSSWKHRISSFLNGFLLKNKLSSYIYLCKMFGRNLHGHELGFHQDQTMDIYSLILMNFPLDTSFLLTLYKIFFHCHSLKFHYEILRKKKWRIFNRFFELLGKKLHLWYFMNFIGYSSKKKSAVHPHWRNPWNGA